MTTYTVPDMSCAHCVATLTRTVQTLDPAARVTADLPARRLTVDNASVKAEAIVAALDEAGYPASVIAD